MFKRLSKNKFLKGVFLWLERELFSVLALLISLGFLVWAQAETSSILSLTVNPAGGVITVTDPDGGESWRIGTTYNITWDSSGVTNVKIEIQRSAGGSWEEIIDSTSAAPGSYGWQVTSPATSQVLIKISNAGDPTVYDISDSTFTIYSGGGGGVPPLPPGPSVLTVEPSTIWNSEEATVVIRGGRLDMVDRVLVGGRSQTILSRGEGEIKMGMGKGVLPAGNYSLLLIYGSSSVEWSGRFYVQYADYQATLIEQSPTPLTLRSGEAAELWVKLKNTSNTTWAQENLYLVTAEPFNRVSPFISEKKIGKTDETEVKSGQETTLHFSFTAPLEKGEYSESFRIFLGENLLSSSLLTWQVQVLPLPEPAGEPISPYVAEWVDQSEAPPKVEAREEFTLWVRFRNQGSAVWYRYGAHPLRLGTAEPRDRKSEFYHSSWVLADRPAVMEQVRVEPGQIASFSLRLKAPAYGGTYQESFSPVAEFKEWLVVDKKALWGIKVEGPTRGLISRIKRSWQKAGEVWLEPPSTGGEPTLSRPGLIDQVWSVLQRLGRTIRTFFSFLF